MSALIATEPIIRARLKKASDKQHRYGVLGLRAQPRWDGQVFEHDGKPVTVVACPSVLAIWQAIEERRADQWTVVLTDVGEDDLGDTVQAHLIECRLFTPDPWDALRSNFSATTVEPALYRSTNDRALANGLLSVITTYTPAPGGVLTRNHAMTAVTRDVLGMIKGSDVEVDTFAVLEWSRSSNAANLADLRDHGELTSAVTGWLADRSGKLSKPVRILLESGRIADLVPLGVVAGLFCQSEGSDERALGMFLGQYGLGALSADDLQNWYTHARGLVTSSLAVDQQQAVLQAAASIVDELRIGAAAASSDLLRHGLAARINALAAAVSASEPALAEVEGLWVEVNKHLLAPTSPTVSAFDGAVRLARWLRTSAETGTGLSDTFQRYIGSDSWVDTALVKARRGSENPTAAAALRVVIERTVGRRAEFDRQFATALADAPHPKVPVIENVVRDAVVPIARQAPTLLLVVDALSMAAANELVVALQQDGWTEISTGAGTLRAGALAVLPTLTQRSRCSLLCGELREGPDTVERTGFLALVRDAGLAATGSVTDPIFHKKALEARTSGASLATDVNNAIVDTDHQRLVAVVLNYVDDTLHHTDPGGADWTVNTITHLRALLAAAKSAGRAVVITSDHGHIIEYGTSAKVDRANTYGQRAHGDFAAADPAREVVVEGPRVLTADHRVVLAVDETIRYGARNAGYHGGATPAEAIVPVLAFVPGLVESWATPVVGAEPSWWYPGPISAPVVMREQSTAPSLFDNEPIATQNPLPDKVIRSKVFAAQVKLAGRVVVKPAEVKALLAILLDSHEITFEQAATVLGVAAARVKGALMQTKLILDVEGYEVLRVGGGVVSVDAAALAEQFGVQP